MSSLPTALLLPADRPLVLFPVRIETRFFPAVPESYTIRIRVYPDTIHVDTHESGLTGDEAEWGRHYWQSLWRAGNDEERRKAAWRQLAERYEPQRASWIAWQLHPLNSEDRPDGPIAENQPLNPPPRFQQPPQLQIQTETWTRAPWTRVLPDHWMAVGYVGGAVVAVAEGGKIPDPLPVGPSPDADVTPVDDQPPIDAGMKWMIDYDEAVLVGMGLELVLPAGISHLDRLLVFGVKRSLTAEDSALRLSELLSAQGYTQGLSFLEPGIPSNNSSMGSSGFSSFDAGYESSFHANQMQALGQDSNGGLLAKAFGLPDKTFQRIERAGLTESVDAYHMNTALWQPTWGYYLEQMMRPAMSETEADETIELARQHFIQYVRAGGPLPAIRCGRQPYGILPVTSLDLWKPRSADGAGTSLLTSLVSILMKLRAAWRRCAERAPRLGASTNPEDDLRNVLRLEATSSSYSIRAAIGRHYFQNLWQFQLIDLDRPGWWAKHNQLVGASLEALGFAGTNTRLNQTVYAGVDIPLKAALVQPGEVATDTRLAPNFIDLLLSTSVAGIRMEAFPDPKPNSLLYVLLRHAALLEYGKAAANILLSQGMMTQAQRREAEIIDVEPGSTVFTAMKQLATVVPAVSPLPLEVFLQQLRSFDDDDVVQLGAFRTSLMHLSGLHVTGLERLMTGTLDLCSYRLDAWITSLATRRLAAMRQVNRTGVFLGAYGWVENLKPGPAPSFAATVPEESSPPVFMLPGNPGLIHAPSLTQAATAAVLRSGHLTHQDVESGRLLAIDLTSERVRLAKWLLDGVRQGQPLGALLGYRFERGLHEGHPGLELDRFIKPFREIAPLTALRLDSADDVPVEVVAANNVVDGLKLQRVWRQAVGVNEAAFFAKLPASTAAELQALRTELSALDDMIDAVSDALMAESVHQAVQGNPSRASATLDAVARGDARPPELDVVETPRSGIALTHRVLVLFGGQIRAAPGWTRGRHPYRGDAAPHLDAWVGRLVGDPSRVRCRIQKVDEVNGTILETHELRFSQLGLSPLDFVYGVESSGEVTRSEFEQRLLLEAMSRNPGLGPEGALRVNFDRDPAWNIQDLSGVEFLELIRAVRQFIARSRGAEGRDLAPSGGAAVPSGIDDGELRQRAIRATEALRSAVSQLKDPNGDLRASLLQMAHFGIAGAIPTGADLITQARSVEREAMNRLERAEAAPDAGAALREVFGASFVVMPAFRPANMDELAQTLADSLKLQGDDPNEAVTWLHRAARVREPLSRLEDALRYAEVLGTGVTLALRVGQLPLRDNDRWVGLPVAGGNPISGGVVSLVAQMDAPFNPHEPLTGLLVDEWIETVPNPTETTGVAFQYDQPDASPPQSILIAVPPGKDHTWTAQTLQQVLIETLDLARLRVVDPEVLEEVHHFLPALFFASNAQDETISTDWTKLTR
ncbi:hypothetical protein [Nitrospira sp. BLG_1]|uniref:hypothetical protein n=1 Tax=Nitrospira sp. BLG_1 TaxID=3395883 RepID=UPI0039BC6F98